MLRTVPSQKTIVAERFFDESGGMQLVIHAPFGARINKAWGLALRKRFCRSFNFELQAAATDNGLNISLRRTAQLSLGGRFSLPEFRVGTGDAGTGRARRRRCSPHAGDGLPGVRWPCCDFMSGKKVPPNLQRMRSEDLLAAVFPEALACQENIEGDIEIPDHPLAARSDAGRDDRSDRRRGASKRSCGRWTQGGIRVRGRGHARCRRNSRTKYSMPIPYAYLDDAPLEERRARAVEMRRSLPESVLTEVGRLDPEAIAEVRATAWPTCATPMELHDALNTLVAASGR